MRCNNCGAELAEGTSFCTYCGAHQTSPAGYDPGYSDPYGADAYIPPVPPKKKKSKSPIGLLITAGIAGLLVIAVIIGLFTNWYGFYGPATRIAVAANNTVKQGNFTIEVTAESGDEEAVSKIEADIDLKNRTLTLFGETEVENYTTYIAIYDGYYIRGMQDQSGYEYFYKEDISDDLEKVFDAYEDAKDMDLDELLETIEEETGVDISDYLNIKEFKKCVKSYFRKLNNNKWLKENAGYSKTKKNGVTCYEFEPNNYRFLKASVECFESAFEDEDDYENTLDDLKESKTSLNYIDLELSFGVKGNKLVEFSVKTETDYSEQEITVEFTNIGSTSIDEDFLEEMLSKAK